jgi:hypothetical protein
MDQSGEASCRAVADVNSQSAVTWVHSYVTRDKTKTFCVYDAPSPEAIRSVGAKNNVPVDAIHEISVLDPYFYH